MRHMISSALAVVLAFSATSIGPAAADEPDLAAMLRLLPEHAATYKSLPLFSYVDLRALERASGIATPESEEALVALPKAEQDAWMRSLFRLQTGPELLFNYLQRIGHRKIRAREAVGFDLFQVDRALAALQFPPQSLMMLAGEDDLSDPENFEDALLPRGFARDEVDGVPVWHRYADNVIVKLKDEASEGDIFADHLPRGKRIAVKPGLLIATNHWNTIRVVIKVAEGKTATASASKLLAPMIDALGKSEVSDGGLIQAFAIMLPDVGFPDPARQLFKDMLAEPGVDIEKLKEKLRATASNGPSLAPYPLALFGDFQAGDDQVNVIALPYGDRATAEEAAKVVADRMRSWQPGATTEGVLARIGGTVETRIIDDPALAPLIGSTFLSVMAIANEEVKTAAAEGALSALSGGATALILVRYPLPPAGSDSHPGALIAAWLRAISNRDLTVLAVP